jgi:CobQ-like glutamine amidotransferase family enzyme
VTGIPSAADAAGPSLAGPSKGRIRLVHVYPREMSIYGDLGNTRCLAWRARRHGYDVEVVDHHPGTVLPSEAHLLMGGGGQDSGQARVEEDLAANAATLTALARDGVPMLMICGMYQLFGNAFITVDGVELPGLGILDVTTRGRSERMIGRVVVDTPMGTAVGYENHSGATELAPGQEPFGRVRVGHGNNGEDGTEGALRHHVIGSYLHGPILPANPVVADWLIGHAVQAATGRPFEPGPIDDGVADTARERQIARLTAPAARSRRWLRRG